MRMDFSLFFLAMIVLMGAIWLLDVLFWAPKRREAGIEKEPVAVEYARSLFPVFLVIFLLRSFVAEPFRIPSSSMEPTLEQGDFILVNKFAYGIRLPIVGTTVVDIGLPERGDVVVFRYPVDPSQDYIKRVIGVPGDEIAYDQKRVYVNGEPLELRPAGEHVTENGMSADVYEEFLNGEWHRLLKMPQRYDPRRMVVTVPEGHYFVMGDNRDNSNDSRVWGLVPEENLVGKAFFIWMNWHFGQWPEWGRIGSVIE
ncbi:MAG TPA: signal peptidase I [Gammaproteobacteria bacterium]